MGRSLAAVADVHYGKGPTGVLSNEEDIPVVGTGGVYGFAKKSLYSGPAVVVGRKGTLGRPQLLLKPFWPADTTYAVIPKHGIDARWLYYSLCSSDLERLNEATGVPSISREWLRRITVGDHSPTEQREVSRVLKCVDEAVALTETLIAKMQQVKAGMMHDLFTRGVTPDGRLRPTRAEAPHLYKEFPLGWIPKEWSPGKLTDYLDPVSGVKPGPFGSSLTKDIYTEAGYRIYGQEQVIAGSLEVGNYYISPSKFAEMRDFEVKSGDVLVSMVGTIGSVLLVAAPFAPGIINPRLVRLRPHTTHTAPKFLGQLLLSNAVLRQLNALSGGGTMPVINGKIVRRLTVPVLPVEEQRKIAIRIEAIASLGTGASIELNSLGMLKSGLMSDLLTGRVRVKVEDAQQE
jgi:type I restriction enzyme S subunit